MKKRSLLILDLGWAGQAIGAFVAGSANKPTDEVSMNNTDSLFTAVATGWMRSEPREAIRWAQDHPHLASLQSVRNYWRADDYTGHIVWIED